jgi:hypothetical protein
MQLGFAVPLCALRLLIAKMRVAPDAARHVPPSREDCVQNG